MAGKGFRLIERRAILAREAGLDNKRATGVAKAGQSGKFDPVSAPVS